MTVKEMIEKESERELKKISACAAESQVIKEAVESLRAMHREVSLGSITSGACEVCGAVVLPISFGWTGGMTLHQCSKNREHWSYDRPRFPIKFRGSECKRCAGEAVGSYGWGHHPGYKLPHTCGRPCKQCEAEADPAYGTEWLTVWYGHSCKEWVHEEEYWPPSPDEARRRAIAHRQKK